MDHSEEILQVLREMRDAQRQHLEEYRKTATRSMEIQEQSVQRQIQAVRIYKRALAAGSVLIIGIVALLIYLLRYLF